MEIPAPIPINLSAAQTAQSSLLSSLKSGDQVLAHVAGRTADGLTLLALGGRQFPVSLPVQPAVGTALTLQARATEQGVRLFILPQPAAASASNSPAAIAPALENAGAAAGAAAAIASMAPALAQSVISALGNQNSISVLLATVMRLGTRTHDLPPDVQSALARLTGTMVPASQSAVSAPEIKTAVGLSGIFLEANLATPVQPTPPQADLKAILLFLRGALAGWLGAESGVAQSARRPAPPQRGSAPRASAPGNVDLTDGMSRELIGRTLLAQTDAALSRLRLMQAASLPGADDDEGVARKEWQMELPLLIGQQASVVHLQINRDAPRGQSPDAETWSMRFAMHLGDAGEVGAELHFVAGHVDAVLWAEAPALAQALNAHLGELTAAFAEAGLEAGHLRVRLGPSTPKEAARAGAYLDVGT